MAANVVNLDALIPREDMAASGELVGSRLDKVDIHHLDDHFFARALRKPDFQRETANWSPDKIADLVRAFVGGDLIPAVILWHRGANVFVIDGAHRLSALLAWVQDDYGDGRKSLQYFGGRVPDEQIRIADRTRRLTNALVGPYAEYAAARTKPQNASPRVQAGIINLAVNSVVAQWVPGVDKKSAEDSFFKINQAATPLDPTERQILKSRNAPNAIAARAIVRGGTGHRYWAAYPQPTQDRIETLAKAIHDSLYEPPIGNLPIKTMDLPVAGRGYSALPFVFDLVNWANDVPDSTKAKDRDKQALPDDPDGEVTIEFLEAVEDIIDWITGVQPSSLGLHPVVYFYTRGGEFQPNAFLATAELVKGFVAQGWLKEFTRIRRDFEEFLLAHKEYITLTIKSTGSGRRSLGRLVRYLTFVAKGFASGMNNNGIVLALQNHDEFAYLVVTARAPAIREGNNPTRRFSRSTKAASFLGAAMQSAVRCGVCGAMVHRNSMQFDHIQPKRDEGGTDASNAQVTHPFCNSTIKG